MTRRAVILFARTPEAEAAAKRLDPRAAVPLFESVTAAWLRAAVAADATPVIACENNRQRFDRIAADVPRMYVDQGCGTFGARLAVVSQIPFESILIAGIDAPPPPDLDRAFAALDDGEVDGVIAPARDGGVNVIGFRTPPLELLRSFSVRDRSIRVRCVRAFARVYVLETASDIDSVADYAVARHDAVWHPYRALLSVRPPFALTYRVEFPPVNATRIATRGPPLS